METKTLDGMDSVTSRATAVVNCGELVTVCGGSSPRTGAQMRDLGIVRNGAMLLRDGVIERTGTSSEIPPLITPDHDIIDAKGRSVLPGFVDAHTHPV